MNGATVDMPMVQPRSVRPLLRYKRSPEVEVRLSKAVGLDPSQLIEQAAIIDKGSSFYLCEECLVYLIGEYHLIDDTDTVGRLFASLLDRCKRYIEGKMKAIDYPEVVKDCYCEVVDKLATRILSPHDPRSEFLQCKFWKVLQSLCINVFNKACATINREAGHISIDDEDALLLPSSTENPEVIAEKRLDQYLAGLHILPEPRKTAFVLRYYNGWPIESADQSIPTLYSKFGKNSRTIRYWFVKSHEELERWLEGRKP